MENYNYEPYYDRYSGNTAHRMAGYTRVLAHPGRAEQASEFNEIQSIQRDYLERLGNSMYRDGYIISGCQLNISDNVLTIAPGKIFLDGLVREVAEENLPITKVGREVVVASILTEIITSVHDDSLRDPAQGAENYNMVGADREKQTVQLSIVQIEEEDYDNVDLGGAVIYTLQGGELLKEKETDNYAFITDTLAERTYDENGNYKVWGLNLKPVLENEDNFLRLHITDGRAYVKGYQVTKPSLSSALIEKATDTRTVRSETRYYTSRSSKYKLTSGPISSVSNFTATVLVTGERVYRQSPRGGADLLNHTPVQEIVSVYTKDGNGNKVIIYEFLRDFQLYGDSVDWSLVGDDAMEPATNTSYYVDYKYNYIMEEGTDYSVENNYEDAYINLLPGGVKPVENSLMYFTYNYVLSRRDLVLLDAKGDISILRGQPDKYKDLITPYNGSPDFLELGYVNVFPCVDVENTLEDYLGEVVNYDEVRFTQDNFVTMLKRINLLEDGMAQLDMERDIEEGEDTSSLSGYFTDSFANINKSDLYYEGVDGGRTIRYSACVDIDMEELTVPVYIQDNPAIINNASSDSFHIYGEIISAPYTESIAVKQTYATGTILVNPYAVYGPLCRVSINPSTDNWVDTDEIKVTNTIENVTYTTSYDALSRSGTQRTVYDGRSVQNNVSSSVAKTIYEYMRVKEVAVTGQAFGSNSTNIKAYFNGNPVSLTATGSTSQGASYSLSGTNYKTVNANENGYFTAKFTIPAKTPCGTASLVVTEVNNLGEEHNGMATYTANGTLLTTTITNTQVITDRYTVLIGTDTSWMRPKVVETPRTPASTASDSSNTRNWSFGGGSSGEGSGGEGDGGGGDGGDGGDGDPVAQSFMMSNIYDRSLTKIGIYFATKSTTRPAIVQVRNMVNGYPGTTVYAQILLNPNQINIPSDPNVPVVTNVELNQPVYCKAGTYYCFVVGSDSNDYSLYYAEMGKNFLGKSVQLAVNPYDTGVMFSSSNMSTWTAHQTSDLKFEIYRSVYTGGGEIIFNDISTDIDITGVMLDAAYQVDGGSNNSNEKSSITWFYKYSQPTTVGGTISSDWLPIDTLVYRDLKSIAKTISLKAILTTDYSTSPYLDRGRISLRSFTDAKEATYISKHLTANDFEEKYQGLKISYLAALPQNAYHRVYYMDTMNGNWVELETDSTPVGGGSSLPRVSLSMTKYDEEFTKYTWTVNKINAMVLDNTLEGANFFKFRFDLGTSVRYNRPRIKQLAVIFKNEF